MNTNFKFLLLILLTLIISCETNPPTVPDNKNNYNKVFVTSNVDGAEIFLDDIFTEKFTPDTIIVTLGEHKISLTKNGFLTNSVTINFNNKNLNSININLEDATINKIVLLEDFANVSCDPCVVSNSIIESLHKSYGNRLVVVKYSANFPSPNDPFYLSAKEENDDKMNFYNILFAPTIIIDGVERPVATDENSIKADIESRFNEPAAFKLFISDSIANDIYIIKTESTLINKNINLNNSRQFVVVIEKEIEFNSPPGSNGETVFHNVMREILPNNNGEELVFTEEQNNFSMEYSTNVKNEWNMSNISVVMFVQDIVSKEVYQASLIEN
jgi:thiol-disulfide isomerase/thioredoxin